MVSKYLIKNATVVSMDREIGTVFNCDVLIEGVCIKEVGKNIQTPAGATVIDGTNCIISPGFIDTHRHTWQSQLRTVTTDFVLSDYMLALRHRYGSCYTAHDAYVGNLVGALESIDNGTTYLIDHSHIMNSPGHADAAVKALRESKIRATFCYAIYANPVWEGSCMDKEQEEQTPNWRLQDAKRVREELFPSNEPEDLIRFGFVTNEPDVTPFDQLLDEIAHGRSLGAAVITAHFNHGKYDPGQKIARRLGEKGLLGPDMLLSHGCTLDDEELAMIKEAGVGISSTPDTELQMGLGQPVAFKAKDLGCAASLGVDVCSNSPADMFQQMRVLLQNQRHTEHMAGKGPPISISRRCEEVLELATLGGARAVGLEKLIGSVTPGKRADLIMTRCESTRMVPVHDPIGALVMYANGSDIDTVFINGEVVKSGGQLMVDWARVREELRKSTADIIARAAKAPEKDLEAARDAFIKMIASLT